MNHHRLVDHHQLLHHRQTAFHRRNVCTREAVMIDGRQHRVIVLLHFQEEFHHVGIIILCKFDFVNRFDLDANAFVLF